MQIWVKNNIVAKTDKEPTDQNFVTVAIGTKQVTFVTSLYDELGGNINNRLRKKDQFKQN